MNKRNIINSIFSLYKCLDIRRRIHLIFIILINILNGILEFTTLFAASFFLKSLLNPNFAEDRLFWVNKIIIFDLSNIVLKYTIIFVIFIFLSTSIRIFSLWIIMKFRVSLLIYIEERIFKNIIYQELDYHINTSTTNTINDLTKNIDKANFFIENLLSLITCSILFFSIVIGLLNINYIITISSVLVLSFLYISIGLFTNNKIKLYGKYELKSSKEFLQIIQESLGSIKDIILSSKYQFFLNKFKYASHISRKYQGLSGYVTTFPRYLFEGIGLIVIGLAGYIVYSINGSSIIPILGTFALGSQKLLPSMQTIYRSWQLLYFYNEGLIRVLTLLKLKTIKRKGVLNKRIFFNREIIINNLSYKYKNSEINSLENINLVINKGENIGVMGITGSGKTTFINILMGLLKPTYGKILVDGIDIYDLKNIDTLYSWRKKINHVPQKVYLTNTTLANNIALGIPTSKISLDKIKFSIKQSSLDELVQNRNNNYFLLVGEDGIKLSGGQKQRIAIARAIYNDLEILILDESTNALDKNTEKKIINNIYNLPNKKTTITISHSRESLLLCDRIIEFKKGKIHKIITKKEFKKDHET